MTTTKPRADLEMDNLWIFRGCDPQRLQDPSLHAAFGAYIREAGIDTFADAMYQFLGGGNGITSIWIVGASCADIHTWPEYGVAVIRCFACGDKEQHVATLLSKLILHFAPQEAYAIPERVFFTKPPAQVPPTWEQVWPLED